MFSTVSATSESKSAAMSEVRAALPRILSELARLGGEVLTAETTRAPLTWSAQSMRTQEEHAHDKVSGIHGPTGRHQSCVSLLITVRDFSLFAGVSAAMTRSDSIEVYSVTWSVDDDNAQWALVRGDAIRAALLKGQDYAVALGGSVVSVDHVADAGLLGGDSHGLGRMTNYGASLSAGGADDLSLDSSPQILSATIEARLTATRSGTAPVMSAASE